MLVLSRKLNESIVIGNGITVTVVSVGRHRVKIGIEAPPEISILRQELLTATAPSNQGAARCDETPSDVSGSPLPTPAHAAVAALLSDA